MRSICPCCGKADVETLGTPALHCHCPACGHRWQTADTQIQGHYYAALKGRNAVPAADRERKLTDRLEDLAPLVRDGLRILEIGCAEGGLGARIKGLSRVDYTGVELSVDAETAVAALDRVIRTPSSTLEDGPYDLLLAFHVLEHISDVFAETRHWHRLLAESGTAVVEVPRAAGHRLHAWDANPEHIHHFTEASLVALFRNAGFELESLSAGHFESPVYNDNLRLIARPGLNESQRRQRLLARFRRYLPAPFVVYGLGGDFRNYVEPYLAELQVAALVDGDSRRKGERIGGLTVTAFDSARHSGFPVLVASVRFKSEIVARLATEGVPPARIVGLDDVFGGVSDEA